MGTNRGKQGEQGQSNQQEFCEIMERATGTEPGSEAWEPSILPLYDARSLSQGDYTQPGNSEKRSSAHPDRSSCGARLGHSHRIKFEGVQTCLHRRVFIAESLNRRSI